MEFKNKDDGWACWVVELDMAYQGERERNPGSAEYEEPNSLSVALGFYLINGDRDEAIMDYLNHEALRRGIGRPDQLRAYRAGVEYSRRA